MSVHDVTCPLCGAKPGQQCVTRTGRPTSPRVIHVVRVHLADQLLAAELARRAA